MVLRVKHTPTRLPTNSRNTPMHNTPLHSISSVCHPFGLSFGEAFSNKEHKPCHQYTLAIDIDNKAVISEERIAAYYVNCYACSENAPR